MNRVARFQTFSKLPVDRKDFLLCETRFTEIVCFLYWCFENTKIANMILHRTERSSKLRYQNPHRYMTQNIMYFLRVKMSSVIISLCFTTLNMAAKIYHSLRNYFLPSNSSISLRIHPRNTVHFIKTACWEPSKSNFRFRS